MFYSKLFLLLDSSASIQSTTVEHPERYRINQRTVTSYNPKYLLYIAGEYFPLFCFSFRLRCGSPVAENDNEAMTSEERRGQGHRQSLDRQSDGGESESKASERDLNER